MLAMSLSESSLESELFRIIEEFNNYSVVGLSSGFNYSILSIMLCKFEEYIDGIFSYFPLEILSYKPYMSKALKGGVRVVISYSAQPKLHISLFKSYGLSFHISGEA